MPLLRNSPLRPGRPFCMIHPCCPEKLLASRGEGGTHFWQRLRGGVPKYYGDSEGGHVFFTGTFPEKDHPPPLREILNSP